MPFKLSTSEFSYSNELAGKILSFPKTDGGEDAELAQEVEGLYLALQRLDVKISKSEFLITNPESNYSHELKPIWKRCRKVLLRVGNEEVLDIERTRSKLCQHTSAVLLCLNLINASSPGRIARRINFQDMSKMRQSLYLIVAELVTQRDGSSTSEENALIWGELERKLARKGYSIMVVRENKEILLDYVKGVGDRGMLDDSVFVRNVKDMPVEVSFDLAGMPSPTRWFSNVDLSYSSDGSAQSSSDLPSKDYYGTFEGFETPELVSDQSDCYSQASFEDAKSEGTRFMSERYGGKNRGSSDALRGLSRQASMVENESADKVSIIEIQSIEREAEDIPTPIPPRSPLRPLSLKPKISNSMPISPLDIGFPRSSAGIFKPIVFAFPEEGYEPSSRSRLPDADALAAEEQNLCRRFQDKDEEIKAKAPSQMTQRVKFQAKHSTTTQAQLALLDHEAKEKARQNRRIAALARLLESEEGHNFRRQRLESMLKMTHSLGIRISEISTSLEAEKAMLEAVAEAAKAERKEIRKQKLKWLLDADHLRLTMSPWRGNNGKSLFERTIGVTDIFETFGGGPVYRFFIHPSWRRFERRDGSGS